MELESLLDIPQIHEFVNLTIRVAGNVAKRGVLGRLFVKARDGKNGKELIQRPRVGCRLKHGKVADELAGKDIFQVGKLFGPLFHGLRELDRLPADFPE